MNNTRWIDYDKFSSLFCDGSDVSIASINKETLAIKDFITGCKLECN